jgi:hypothetical protein
MRIWELIKRKMLKFVEVGFFPRPDDPNILGVGKSFVCEKGETVIAERIIACVGIGNPGRQKYFEITANGEQHTISMLEFYHQLNGTRPSEEDVKAWESIECMDVVPIVKKEANGTPKTENN